MPIRIVSGKHKLQFFTGAVVYQIPGIYCNDMRGRSIEQIVHQDSSGYKATIVSGLVAYLERTNWSANYEIDQRFVTAINDRTIEIDALFLVEEHYQDLRGFQLEGCFQFPNDDKYTIRFHRPATSQGAPYVNTKTPIRNAVRVAARIVFGMWDLDFVEFVSSKCYATDTNYIVYEESQVESETAAFRAYPARAYQVIQREFTDIITDAKRTESLVSSAIDKQLDGLLSALQIVPSNDSYRTCMQFVWLYEQLKKYVAQRSERDTFDRYLTDHRNEIAHGDVANVHPEIFRELQFLALKAVMREDESQSRQ